MMTDPPQQIVFFVEERSCKVLLESLRPRLLPDELEFACISFEGRQGLEKHLKQRLLLWQRPNTLFVVMIDKDSTDCLKLKKKLTAICHESNKPTTLVRIVCHDLESWYLGDLQAVGSAFGIESLSPKQRKIKFRDPDRIANPKQELRKLINTYQPIDGSRRIGRKLSLDTNCSVSFNVFISGIRCLLTNEER